MKKPTKKQRVEKYLNQLMKGRYFKIEDLLSLTSGKLQENTPLLDISQSTITPVLNSFKEKYGSKNRKPEADSKKTTEPLASKTPDVLVPSEISSVRNIINWFENKREDDLQDFEDLKSALSDIGMDYRKLLRRYRNL